MYHHITGKLVIKKPTEVVLECAGVGYCIRIPLSSHDKLPQLQSTATLYTYLHVREDLHVLYGFATEDERTLFQMLIGVNGVGPVAALAVLSGISPVDLVCCIRNSDVTQIKRVKGIGPKTAQKIIIDLQGRVDSLTVASGAGEMHIDPAASDAVLALISLGMSRKSAEDAVIKALKTCKKTPPPDELVKLALQNS